MKYSWIALILFISCPNLFAQEERSALLLPWISLTQKNSDLYIPSIFVKGKASKESIAKVSIDSSGVLKAGLIDGTGKFIVKPTYKDFGKTESGIIPLVNANGKSDFYSLALRQLLSVSSDEYKIISSDLILISQNFKWGVIYVEDNLLKRVPTLYKKIDFDSSSQSLKLYNYNNWKIIADNDSLISKNYSCDSISFIDQENFYCFLNGKKGLGNSAKGEIVLAGEDLFKPLDTIVCVKTTLNDILNNFSEYSLYLNGIYRVDSTGKIIYPFSASQYSSYEKVGKALIKVKSKNLYGLIDSTGKVLIQPLYDSLRGPFAEDIIFIAYKGKLVSIFDEKGMLLSESQERPGEILDFSEGRARFSKGGYWGFIDVRGNTRVAPQYKEARDFKEGLAAVQLKGKWCFIDKDENIIAQPLYDEVRDFVNGIAAVRKSKQWFFIDKKGERTSVSYYDSVALSPNGKWMTFRNGKEGLVSSEGKELLAPRYDFIEDVDVNRVIVEKNGKYGVIDYAENFIIPLKYDKIKHSKVLNKFLVMEKGKEETFSLKAELRTK